VYPALSACVRDFNFKISGKVAYRQRIVSSNEIAGFRK